MAGLLDGMRVLDVSMWRPMPHATQILCDLGADVLKVERPGGDPMRSYPELFAALARGKRSIELDLKSDAGRARLAELVAECDVLCESWRPGVAARLGLGADALRAARPELIYCSISGYGQHGPWRDMPGHDLNYQALAGAIAPRPGDSGPPPIPRLPAADLEAGTLAALLVCAAWAKRLTTGEGECIDVAMADVMAWWIGPRGGVAVDVGEDAGDKDHGDGTRPGGSPGYGVFATADGAFITLAPLSEPHLWQAISTALVLGDELAATTFAERIARVGEINARVAAAIAGMTRDDALERLRRAGAPVAPVLTPEEASTHEQFVARRTLGHAGGVRSPLLPAWLGVHPRAEDAPVPAVGAHPEGFGSR
ncbi:MAG TPA: CoA transferase [Acidimicrobiia bacterium]|jgi:crotonobetainyl-CoA:carnitine CoA-transferase CaiB-like acyl-CoA transferase